MMDPSELQDLVKVLLRGMNICLVVQLFLDSIEEGCRRSDVCDTDILEILVKKAVEYKKKGE